MHAYDSIREFDREGDVWGGVGGCGGGGTCKQDKSPSAQQSHKRAHTHACMHAVRQARARTTYMHTHKFLYTFLTNRAKLAGAAEFKSLISLLLSRYTRKHT